MINKVLHRFLLVCCILFAGPPLVAQSPYLSHFSVRHGLAGNNCFNVLQDSKGYIWVATDAGVSRFDGKEFETFTVDNGLPDTQILQLKEDRAGRIWFLALNGKLSYHYKGLIYNDANNAMVRKLNLHAVIVSFLEDSRGRLWFGSNANRVGMWDGKNFRVYTSPEDKAQLINALIHEDQEGRIWAVSNAHASLLNGKTFKGVNSKILPLSYKTAANMQDRTMLFIGKNGLNRWRNGQVIPSLPIDSALLAGNPGYFFYSPRSSLWLSSQNGVLNISNGTMRRFLPGVPVTQTIEDRNGNMWFTSANGLYMLPRENNQVFILNRENGLANESVRSVVMDKNNNLWLGSDKGQITMVNSRNFACHTIDLPDKRKFRSIKQLELDGNSLYFASEYGLGVIRNIYKRPHRIDYLREANDVLFVVKHFSLGPNRELALALSSGVVIIPDREAKKLEFSSMRFRERQDFFKDRSYHAFYDRSHRLWFSNIEGLFEFSAGRLNAHRDAARLLNKRVNDMAETADGTLIIATDGYGLVLYKPGGAVRHLTRANGLTDNICNRLFISGKDIWVVTNKGINKIKQDGNRFSVSIFEDGKDLLNNEVNDVFIGSRYAYFGTNSGLVFLATNKRSTTDLSPPPIYITAVSNNKSPLAIDTDSLVLSPGSNNLSIDYSALNFRSGNVVYRYRLKAGGNWTQTKNRRIELSSLEPGDYTFQVSARNQNSSWSNPATLRFKVTGMFWQTPWFILISIILAAYIFYRLAAGITKRQKNKEQKQLLLQNKVLILEQQALQAMMNPHFVFNVMNSIQHFINTQDNSAANRILTGFAKLIRKNLDICTKSYIAVEEELEYLNLYLKLEKNRFGEKLNYLINVDPAIDREETMIPSMLLQPYIENAIWHGIMPKETGGTIHIAMREKDDHLFIEIRDDGVGIENSRRNQRGGHSSKGMELTRERILLLSQIASKPIQLHIFQNGVSGTVVQILLPLS
ncbi:diguanylate cyclase [Pedobacter yulinensis]|uniref:Diguanylate cyclase n=1 Tax=Pedobacter yulinensis TaxID=2126353 RepID=A0A2T3HI65_9SPHI|nr:two-component regulator propeller domain-containing protein [Pedobacter yulinensis]PST82127.1 diguanylate cyclase [Pedobacter yulinensis]